MALVWVELGSRPVEAAVARAQELAQEALALARRASVWWLLQQVREEADGRLGSPALRAPLERRD